MRLLLVGVKPPFAPWPYVNRDLARACRAAKIPKVSPNDLRRTFASLLVQDGVPLDVVAKLLGHSSAAMVYRVYGRFTPNALAELVSPGVPLVYQRSRKTTHRKEATVRFLREIVGQDRLELSANGLRDRTDSAETPRKQSENDSGVPRVYQAPLLVHLPPRIGEAIFTAAGADGEAVPT